MDINNMDINELITVVLALAGGITVIGGAWAYIKKWVAESKSAKNSEIILEHTERLKRHDERIKMLEKANASQDKYVNAMCATMIALLDHSITGNSVDKLKKARDEMNEFLIHRGEG